MTRLYIGSAAQLLGTGVLIGMLLGWLLTRWYFVGLLRRIQRRVGGMMPPWARHIKVEKVDGQTVTIGSGVTYGETLQTELRRREL